MTKVTSLAWSTISILSLILTSNFTQLSSIRLFFPCSSCTWPKNHANVLYILVERAYARVRIPSKRHAHNNQPCLFQLLHTVSAQYTGQALSMVKNEGLWLSAHGRLPGTLRYALNKRYALIDILTAPTCMVMVASTSATGQVGTMRSRESS